MHSSYVSTAKTFAEESAALVRSHEIKEGLPAVSELSDSVPNVDDLGEPMDKDPDLARSSELAPPEVVGRGDLLPREVLEVANLRRGACHQACSIAARLWNDSSTDAFSPRKIFASTYFLVASVKQ